MTDRRTQNIHIRATKDIHEEARRQAKALGLSLSSYITMLIIKHKTGGFDENNNR